MAERGDGVSSRLYFLRDRRQENEETGYLIVCISYLIDDKKKRKRNAYVSQDPIVRVCNGRGFSRMDGVKKRENGFMLMKKLVVQELIDTIVKRNVEYDFVAASRQK